MARKKASAAGPRPGGTRRDGPKDVPDVYRAMLADAVPSSPTKSAEEGRAVKKRRVGGRIVTQEQEAPISYQSDQNSIAADQTDIDDLFEDVKPNQQHVIETGSEDSADSDMDWEEVRFEKNVDHGDRSEPEEDDAGGFNLILNADSDKQKVVARGRAKRKPMTAEDKKLRLEIHKMHLCCLLAHVYIRNHWCNDEKAHAALRRFLTKKMISYLNPDEYQSQFQRSRSFMDGLTQASETFRGNFKIGARGMSRSRWADSPETLALMQPPDDVDLPMQIPDFREAARDMNASRDVGAQLFCAMLRSAGADARLVCSLQPLPFQPSQSVELDHLVHRNSKPAEHKNQRRTPEYHSGDESAGGASAIKPYEMGQRSTSPAYESLLSRKQRKSKRESKYPIYWVEAFNEAVQKWVPVDPLVTKTIAKPSKFEPPAGEQENGMSYVIAFEDDGSVRDVSKRYVKAYNAKTRRGRVEITNGGERWWQRVTRMYRSSHSMDRDQVEDAELAAKEAAEPMPRNVQDFKDHPYYALERHLRRHEVIHPKREVGKLGAGRASSTSQLEPIFRRRDVHMVKSADKWYRLGREIKSGEQPLKHVTSRRTRQLSVDPDDAEAADGDDVRTPLYAAHQTSIYSAPPVRNGQIPKNAYGNLDIYVSSMIPPGGTHIPHSETAKAAKIIGVDYADAVTGFAFKGRHGTAIVNGAVVANEYAEAVKEVIRCFEDERARAEEDRRSLEALRTWKKLLAGLRIRRRIAGYHIEGEQDAVVEEDVKAKIAESDEDGDEDEDDGGGFFPDMTVEDHAEPIIGRRFEPQETGNQAEDGEGGFLAEEPEVEPVAPYSRGLSRPSDAFVNSIEDDEGGGFLVNDDDADAEEALLEARAAPNEDSASSNHPSENYFDNSNHHTEPPDDSPAAYRAPQDEPITQTRSSTHDKASKQPTKNITSQQPKSKSQEKYPPDNRSTSQSLHHPPNPTLPILSATELEDSKILEQLYEIQNDPALPATTTSTTPSAQPAKNQSINQILKEKDSSPHYHTSTTKNNPLIEEEREKEDEEEKKETVPESSRSSVSDKDSLLSHDPDDEDAEPEWLA